MGVFFSMSNNLDILTNKFNEGVSPSNVSTQNIENAINLLLTILFVLDIAYIISNYNIKIAKQSNGIDYIKYFDDFIDKIKDKKANILKISLFILWNAILSSYWQIYHNNLISDLILGKPSLYLLIITSFINLVDTWTNNVSKYINSDLRSSINLNCHEQFLYEISKSKIENLDRKYAYEIEKAMSEKKRSINAIPTFCTEFIKCSIYILVNIITLFSVSYVFTFQVIFCLYIFSKYYGRIQIIRANELGKKNSKSITDRYNTTQNVLHDIKTYHQFSNILTSPKTFHVHEVIESTKDTNDASNILSETWNLNEKSLSTINELIGFLIIFQISINIQNYPKEKIGILVSACGNLTWNFNWLLSIISRLLEDIASYNTYLDFINELESENKSKIEVDVNVDLVGDFLNFYWNNPEVSSFKFNKGFNQITGESGSGKTLFLKSLFFKNEQYLNKMVILYQSSSHEFRNKCPKDLIVQFLEYENDLFDRVYKCIKLDKNKEEQYVGYSGGEEQKMRIGMVLYQALILKSKVIILDEPDNGIDPPIFNKIMSNIGEEFKEYIIIFTTHKGDSLEITRNEIDIEVLNQRKELETV